MALATRDEVVESIRQRIDIVELVSRYVKLKKVGSNLVGLCPFHTEKTPSFSVSSRKGFFHCFGCKASGDAFSFLMRVEGKTFPEVLEELAGVTGIQLPARRSAGGRSRAIKQRLLEINELAAAYYEDQLWKHPSGKRARDYLTHRGMSEEIIRRFRLGYAPGGWRNLTDYVQDQLHRLQASLGELQSLGLVGEGSRGPYDVFRDRLVFPIIGPGGKVNGFGARALDPDERGPKYINSRQSMVFDKGEMLYGLHQARAGIQRVGEVVLVEGYFDVLSLVKVGVLHVVATCGTALTERHARLIRRFAQKAVTVFDADQAGLAASYRSAELLLKHDLSAYMVTLPAGEDPDSFVRQGSGDEFQAMLDRAMPAVQVLAGSIRQEAREDAEVKVQAVRRLIPLLSACKDSLRLGGYLSWVTECLGLDEEDLRRAVHEYRHTNRASFRDAPAVLLPSVSQSTLRPEEERCLVLLLKFPHLAACVAGSGVVDKFESSTVRDLIRRVIELDSSKSAASLLTGMEDEQLRNRLSGKVMDDAEFPEATAELHVDACIRKIRLRAVKDELRRLQESIQQAETAGRKQESTRLKKDKLQLEKEKERMALGMRVGKLS